ncbi:MAG: AsmA family protein [Bryobacteraceae bacterium]|nr:AsmA family protein [Bryobacteraceae bacterium]
MKKKLLVVASVLATLAVAAGLALVFVDANTFRPQIERLLTSRLKRPVKLGEIRLKLFPLGLSVSDVSVGESAEFASERPFVAAKSLELRAELLPLLRGNLQADSFVLIEPAIELVKNKAGVWNYQSLTASGGGEAGSQTTVSLKRVEIEDGRIAMTDAAARTPRTVYEHIDLSLTGLAPGAAPQFTAKMRLPGSGRLEAEGGGAPLKGTLTLAELAVADLRKTFALKGLEDVEGVLAGKADWSVDGNAAALRGNLDVARARVGGIRFDETLTAVFDAAADTARKSVQVNSLTMKTSRGSLSAKATVKGYDSERPAIAGSGTLSNAVLPLTALKEPLDIRRANVSFENDAARLKGLELKLGKSTLTGRLGIRNFSAPSLDFAGAIDRLNLAEIQSLMNDSKGAPGGNPLAKITGQGSLTIGELDLGTLVLNKVQAECTLDRGIIRLSPVRSELFAGQLEGEITANTRGANPVITAKGALARVDTNRLLTSMSSVRDVIFGLLGGEFYTRFEVKPGQEMVRSLSGQVKLDLADGKLQGPNILNQLASIGRFTGAFNAPESFTNVTKMRAVLNFADGVATAQELALDLNGATLGGTGTLNLVDQSLGLRVLAVFSKEMSQRVGGKGIGGLLTTALANAQGELVIPAIVSGSLGKPKFTPDAERVAQMKVKSLLPSSGLLGILKGKTESQPAAPQGSLTPAPQQAAPENTTQKAVESLLDRLRRREKKD